MVGGGSFAAVNAANVVLADRTGSRRWLSALGAVLCLVALVSLIWETAQTAPGDTWTLVAMIAIGLGVEAGFRRFAGRKLALPCPSPSRARLCAADPSTL